MIVAWKHNEKKKWTDLKYIFEVGFTEFANKLDVGWGNNRERSTNWQNKKAAYGVWENICKQCLK